ncbi:MAG: hypothetical protein HQK96_20300 [Nitrospirae bacterium]|nr:hypothetical protein [Nitrospirota bacterium]
MAGANLTINLFTPSGTGYSDHDIGNAANQLPRFIVDGVIVSGDSLDTYTTIVINTSTKAVSYYNGFNFNWPP